MAHQKPKCIIDHREVDGVRQYLVTWEQSPTQSNSWLPISKLYDHQQLLFDYLSANRKLVIPKPTLEQSVKQLYNSLQTYSSDEIKSLIREFLTISGLKFPCSKKEQIEKELNNFISKDNAVQNLSVLRNIRRDILIEQVLEKRRQQILHLQQFELEVNLVSDSSEIIKIENLVDLEVIPSDFIYTNEYIPGPGVIIPNDPPVGCDCAGGCYSDKCCPQSFNSQPPYDKNKRIVVPNGIPIYECNVRCTCNASCANRTVQQGSKVKLSIFRTFNDCGWGVRALQYIPKGTFIARYIGEIISWEEADKRGNDENIRRYLFDLDFNAKNHKERCAYTVDASKYSNVTHFINHSCDPNLCVYSVWINCLDPDLHHLCLFANRNIKSGEELTFDYAYMSDLNTLRNSDINECKCGSSKCKRYFI